MAGKIDCGGDKARYCRERKMAPRLCKKGSFRTIKRRGKGKKVVLVVCRPKGSMTTRVQTILWPKSSRRCAVCRR